MRLTLLSLIAVLTLAGCETFEGFGRDVGTAGDVITDEARAAQ